MFLRRCEKCDFFHSVKATISIYYRIQSKSAMGPTEVQIAKAENPEKYI